MSELLQFFIWLPFAGMFIALFIPKKKESLLSGLAISTAALHLAGIVALFAYWLANGYPVLDIKHAVLYRSGNIEIFIDFYFDKVTATFCLVGSFVAFLVTIFSRYYMHRDEGSNGSSIHCCYS